MIRKSKKTEEELRDEYAKEEIEKDPYQELTFNDPYHQEKARHKGRVRGKWDRLKEKLDKK